jgi:hypothetical protein
MKEIFRLEDLQNLVLGATLMGTGGGGDPNRGLSRLKEVIDSGKKINLINLNEMSKDKIIVVPYYVGSIAPTTQIKKSIKIENTFEKAIEEMEKLLGTKVSGVVAGEIGGANTPAALAISAKLGIPAIDGDLVGGRAAPELHQCACHIFGITECPSIIVTGTGNIVIIKQYADIDDYESMIRHISMIGSNAIVVDTPMTWESAVKAIIPGTITRALNLGAVLSKSKIEENERLREILNIMAGWKIFEGVVDKFMWSDEEGFLKGEIFIKGINKYQDNILKSWIKNEHIMVFLNDKPIVMPPDSFALLKEDFTPITNTNLKVGMKVIGIASKAAKIWRSNEGLKYFGPKHFGFDYDYVPVEDLVKG